MRLASGNFTEEGELKHLSISTVLAKELMDKYRRYQEDYYQEDIQILAGITERNHLFTNPLVESFRASDFSVSIASASYSILRRFLREKGLSIVQSILKDQLNVEGMRI